MDEDADPGLRPLVMSRRGILMAGALAGIAAVLAACGSSDASASAVSSRAGSADPSGDVPDASVSQASPVQPGSAAPAPAPSPFPRASGSPTPPAPRDSSMVAENRMTGSSGWDLDRVPAGVEAYLGAASVAPGGALSLRARGTGTVSVEWYRLGWYGGAGGRLLRTDHGVQLRNQPRYTVDATTGLIECGWTPVLQTEAPAGVKSGMLLAVLRNPAGQSVANCPIVLRPDPSIARRAPVLFVSASSTWQAYNAWGGADFYGNNGHHRISATQDHRAAQVSYDRPYLLDSGAGYLRRWELQFIRWAERNGRDIEYMADVDLERNPGLVDGRRLVVMCGHPEYWSRPMRARIEAAVAQGINVAFITGNEVYWQTRIEDGPAGPATRLTSYKSRTADPIMATHPELTTCRWREAPVSDPEATLIGQMYGSIVHRVADWIVREPRHWLYEGTGFGDGDRIRNLVGQEFDTFFPDLAQPGTVLLARSPVEVERRSSLDPGATPSPPFHTSTVYAAQSGATVFAAGTFQWSWALDGYGNRSYLGVQTPVDPRVGRMTRNLLDRLGDGPLAP
jgi:hypothetical protein